MREHLRNFAQCRIFDSTVVTGALGSISSSGSCPRLEEVPPTKRKESEDIAGARSRIARTLAPTNPESQTGQNAFFRRVLDSKTIDTLSSTKVAERDRSGGNVNLRQHGDKQQDEPRTEAAGLHLNLLEFTGARSDTALRGGEAT